MKNLLFLLFALTGFTATKAQKLERAKDYLTRNKLAEANKEVDAFLAIEKNKSNSEAYYVKAKVLQALAKDAALKGTVENPRQAAIDNFIKYLEMEAAIKDSTKRNIALTMDNNQPVYDLYRDFSAEAAKDYNDNKFAEAAEYFGKGLEVFEFLRKYKLVSAVFDTTTTLYAGISAEKAGKKDLAAKYYSKIVDNKIKSEGFIEIYKWMSDYYRQKEDIVSAEKYIQYGRDVYPEDSFWDAFDLEMMQDKGTKDELFAKYEQVIASNPTNFVFPYNYAVELYQAGYTQDLEKRPANSKELIEKSIRYLIKCTELSPDYASAYMLLGQIQYNIGVDINNEMKAIKIPSADTKLKPEEMKKREELKKKKEDLRAQTNAQFDKALPYLEKVEKLLDTKGKLKMEDKMILKDCLDVMVIIYETKGNKEKASEYTDKYNDIDKKHSGN